MISIIIDVILIAIYLLTVVICYKRGFLKGLFGVAKIILSFIGTYYLQTILQPLLERYIPKNIELPEALSGNFLDQIVQTFLSNFVSSVIIFIAVFLVLSLISNLLLGLLEDFVLTRILNRLGGLIVGLVLGGVIVIIASYLISFFLLMNNSTTGIVIINESYIMKNIVENNVPLLIQIISK